MISLKYFDTIKPYPSTQVLGEQLNWGKSYTKYGTVYPGNKIKPALPYWSPLSIASSSTNNPRKERTIKFKSKIKDVHNSSEGIIFTVLIHIYNVVNYDFLHTYIKNSNIKIFSWHQFLSTSIFYLGFLFIIKNLFSKKYTSLDGFIDIIIILFLFAVSLFAVETRFSIVPITFLSIRTAQMLLELKHFQRNELIILTYNYIIVIILSALLSTYVQSLTGISSYN